MRNATRSVKRSDEAYKNIGTARKVPEHLYMATNNTLQYYIVVIVKVTDCQH